MLNEVFACESIVQHEPSLNRIYHAIQGIQLLQIVLYYPLTYSVMCAYMRNENTDSTRKALVRMFQSIEKFHFVNTRISDSRANKVETLYAEYCQKFNDCNTGFSSLVSALIGKMKNEYTESEAVFTANFKELEYSETSPSKNAILYYVFDRFNNYNEDEDRMVDPLAWVDYYSPARNVRRRLGSIEHYSSQHPRDGEAIASVHNIGNLFVLGSELNGRLSNFSPEEKMAKLKGEFYPDIGNNRMLKEFVDGCNDDWNEENIEARAINLAERAYNTIWKL